MTIDVTESALLYAGIKRFPCKSCLGEFSIKKVGADGTINNSADEGYKRIAITTISILTLPFLDGTMSAQVKRKAVWLNVASNTV